MLSATFTAITYGVSPFTPPTAAEGVVKLHITGGLGCHHMSGLT